MPDEWTCEPFDDSLLEEADEQLGVALRTLFDLADSGDEQRKLVARRLCYSAQWIHLHAMKLMQQENDTVAN